MPIQLPGQSGPIAIATSAQGDGTVALKLSGLATAPVNTVLPVISGTLAIGQTLTASTGTWTGTAPITYTYQWKRNGVAIGGATNSTYTTVLADLGATITVTVTATNAAGSTSATSAGVGPIGDVVTSGLVARYACNDATSGSAVTTVTDSAGVGPWNLTATGHTWNSTGISFTGELGSNARNTSFAPAITTAYTFMLVINMATPDTKGINYVCALGNGTTIRPSLLVGGNISLPPAKTAGIFDGTNIATGGASVYTTAADGGVWRTVCAAYDNAASPKTTLYKDGSALTVASTLTGALAAFNTLILGYRADIASGALGLPGTVAYFLVYNRALSAAEVVLNHNALRLLLAPRGISLF